MAVHKKYLLEVIVFVSGAVVMIFELAGSRVLGPYMGTSIFIWTSIIGIILGSLSLGYYLGGRLADKTPKLRNLSLILLTAAILIGITILIKGLILESLQTAGTNIKLGSVISSLVLFGPASIMLGMVSPYAVRLKMENLKTSGRTVGNLYAISTIGSIAGTFLAGFYLIPLIGTTSILILLTALLFLISIATYPKIILPAKIGLFVAVIFFLAASNWVNSALANNERIDVDTEYSHVWIYDYTDIATNSTAKRMQINAESHSAMFLNDDELVHEYTKYYRLAKHFKPNLKTTLMFGGGAYSYPKDFLAKFSDATIDVVEIDPGVTELARKYFKLVDNPRLNIYHEDGRVFLNQTKNKYDVIFGDAFSSFFSIPYQLTTKEAVQKKFDILNKDGVVLLNVISALEGNKSKFLRAEYRTYKSIFPQVYLFPVTNPNNKDIVQNIMLVALKSTEPTTFENSDEELNRFLKHLWTNEIETDLPILTDDHAPVDFYISEYI